MTRTTPVSAPLAFLDTETVTLDPGHDVIWEIGVITRDPGQPDQEWLFQLRPNIGRAHPEALKVGRFDERYQVGRGAQAIGWSPPALALAGFPPAWLTYSALATSLRALLDGRHVVGAVPNFDTERLSLFLRKHLVAAGDGPGEEYRDPWHYHLCDVENLAVGYLRGYAGSEAPDGLLSPPWDFDELTKALGLNPPTDEKHTALGDCRWARSIYDLVMGDPVVPAGPDPSES